MPVCVRHCSRLSSHSKMTITCTSITQTIDSEKKQLRMGGRLCLRDEKAIETERHDLIECHIVFDFRIWRQREWRRFVHLRQICVKTCGEKLWRREHLSSLWITIRLILLHPLAPFFRDVVATVYGRLLELLFDCFAEIVRCQLERSGALQPR